LNIKTKKKEKSKKKQKGIGFITLINPEVLNNRSDVATEQEKCDPLKNPLCYLRKLNNKKIE